jgi:tripartite-type tricarboxylate transporter receptor subunit TctC
VISYVAGLQSKIVTGYRGAGDMSLAVMRNEVDCGVLSADSALPLVQNQSIKPIALFGSRRWPDLPDVPTVREMTTPPADKHWIIELRQKIGEAQRAMVAAPGVPPDRVEFLRTAFAEVLTDRALLAEGVGSKREIDYLSGGELQRLVDGLMTEARVRLPEFRKIVLESYF